MHNWNAGIPLGQRRGKSTIMLALPESCIRHFAFELPLMAKGIIAVSRQPECCVDYKKDNVILTEASGKSEEITSQVKMLSDN